MDFIVDKVSEDSFYENLFVGLDKILEKLPSVSEPYLERFYPVQHNLISNWEQKHGVLLPEDLRAFYASTNGLLYTYNFFYSEESEKNKVIGKIEINSLNNLIQIYGYEIKPNPGVSTEGDRYELRLGPESKLFELVNLSEMGRVILIYLNHRYLPTIWIHNSSMKFYFLADDFTTYLRMCIHHLGIPFWQFSFCPDGLPEWSEMVFRLLSPANLPLNRKIEDMKRSQEKIEDENTSVINKIDCNIFRTSRTQSTSIEQHFSGPRQKRKNSANSKFLTKTQKKIVDLKK